MMIRVHDGPRAGDMINLPHPFPIAYEFPRPIRNPLFGYSIFESPFESTYVRDVYIVRKWSIPLDVWVEDFTGQVRKAACWEYRLQYDGAR